MINLPVDGCDPSLCCHSLSNLLACHSHQCSFGHNLKVIVLSVFSDKDAFDTESTGTKKYAGWSPEHILIAFKSRMCNLRPAFGSQRFCGD